MEVVLSGPIDVVSAEQRAPLARLAPLLPRGAYLAGGVAIAARFGHRTSRDLDVFVEGALDAAALADSISILGQTAPVTSVADRTLYLEVNGVPVILGYRHALLHRAEAVKSLTVPLASVDDLMAMKLSAIGPASRGAAET